MQAWRRDVCGVSLFLADDDSLRKRVEVTPGRTDKTGWIGIWAENEGQTGIRISASWSSIPANDWCTSMGSSVGGLV